ncbi:MAG: HAD family hydrolase [Chloroflexia bacterium]|nr:HAD family hydrolase [Chloroflexia bacterium]
MTPNPAPRLLLFDLDDTLCDYTTARDLRLRLAFTHGLARSAPAIPGGAPRPAAGTTDAAAAPDFPAHIERLAAASVTRNPHGSDHFSDLLRDHGLGGDPATAAAAIDWYRENRFHGLALFEDAEATLLALRRDPVTRRSRIGLVTNGPSEVQRAKIEVLAVERLVDFILVSEEVGAWKPDPAIFAEALRRGGAAPAETLFAGDSMEHDMAGASAAGLRTVWVNRDGRSRQPGEVEPDHEIRRVGEMLPLLGIGTGRG